MEDQDNRIDIERNNRVIPYKLILAFVISNIFFSVIGGFLGASLFVNNQKQSGNVVTNASAQQTVNENSAVISSVKQASPAVVSISGKSQSVDFFGNTQSSQTAGTGFLVSKDGLILTNKHVVSDSNATYTVSTSTGKQYNAKIQALDNNNDIALLKIDANNLPYVVLGNSASLQIGQEAIAIGNALGQYQNTVTVGVISALNRSIQAGSLSGGGVETLNNMLQIDVAINPGNSGGPLVNLDGQVIGINTAIDQQGQSIGFAIPINTVKTFLQNNTPLFL
ncbi:MAG: trypsin-like peptidase domain-containing protein [Patescibacteria group bacterium]|jgi:serine protease Do|nr:trypsin-like peptidase domain-containing protein [Patescibacteria group bacterium]